MALVPDGGAERGLAALFTEVERVIQHGFTQTELDREKSDSLHYLDEALADKDKSPSGPLADELVRHVIQDEPVPGIVYEQAMAQRFLPGITLEEVNALAKSWIPEGNRVVAVTAPERAGLALPTQARLASVIFSTTNAKVDAYVDSVSTQPLIAQMPTPGTIARAATRADIGATRMDALERRQSDPQAILYKEDEVLFRAYSPGGTSTASDVDLVPAETADEVVSEGGLGSFNGIDLNKMLAGATTAVRADIGDADEGLRGGSAKKDVERMLQFRSTELHGTACGCRAVRRAEDAAACDAREPAGAARCGVPRRAHRSTDPGQQVLFGFYRVP
ncbi:MAG: hypothetical protein QM736_08505 [Vicinamibacterales bacterium]